MYESRHKYQLKSMLVFFKLSKSTYFYILKSFKKIDKDVPIKDLILEIFKKNKSRYGYRRITLELKNRGFVVNHKKVRRLMNELNIFGIKPKAKYKSYKGEIGKTCKNLLLNKIIDKQKNITFFERNFKTEKVNQIWSTDVSEFHIPSGKLYLSPIIDAHNREIISYSVSRSPNFKQIKDMLDRAFEKHKNLDGLIFHSDQGWQYQMEEYRNILKQKNILQSMSRKGNCYDNCIIEIFFGTMKNEMFYGHEYEFNSLDELEQAIHKYIKYYNEKRIITKLKGMTPKKYRYHSIKNNSN
ncbi:IS3 family transposase [Mycoplasmopsis arginini]|uniref:IS3 family transposase n=2 Tax=Mycoplasmopsis arginini TaxID=2094 RepID=UPI0035117BF0